MGKANDFRNFVYRIENIVDEFVIVALSLSTIVVAVYSVFFTTRAPNLIQFGQDIFPWITMVALMIIGRELWLMNRKISAYLNQEGGE
jgi:hypothetical protein